jgi:NADPH:quinone reductase-like Zn-dependent oxidoreductase
MIQSQDDLVLIFVQTHQRNRLGVEFSGVVEGVGQKVTAFKPGDLVTGTADAVFAEYVCVHSESIKHVNHG